MSRVSIKIVACHHTPCDVVWLMDFGCNFAKDQGDIEAFWRRDIRDGDNALVCKSCYVRVKFMLAHRVARGLLTQGEIPWAEGPSAVGWDQAPAPSPPEDENHPTWT